MNQLTLPPAATAAASQSPAARQEVSRPVIQKTLVLYTQPAQRIADRVVNRAIRALYAIGVIIPIVAEEKAADQLNDLVRTKLAETARFLARKADQVTKLVDDNAVNVEGLTYSAPRTLRLEVSSPTAMTFVRLLEEVDTIAQALDQLWFAGILDEKQIKKARWELQGHMAWVANQFIGFEKRARATAAKRGTEGEVDKVAGPQTAPIEDGDREPEETVERVADPELVPGAVGAEPVGEGESVSPTEV